MATGDARVSIVIPCFNAGRMLRSCLASVLRQTHPAIEIVFVDNGSTDGSDDLAARILEAGGRDFKIARCPARGVNHARNHGFGLATGDYIQWLDADDELAPDKIARQLSVLETSGDDIAYGDWIERHSEADGTVTGQRLHRERPERDQLRRVLSGVWYPPHLYLLRRSAAELLQREQAWWPERKVATDIEYSAFAALLGLRFRHVAEMAAIYHNWAAPRISATTPYEARISALDAIFRRVEARAAALTPSPLSSLHRRLLGQSLAIVHAPRGSYTLAAQGGRRHLLRHHASGRTLALRPREAVAAQAMLGARPLIPGHHATALAQMIPVLAGEEIAVLDLIERMHREGVLETAPTDFDRSGTAA